MSPPAVTLRAVLAPAIGSWLRYLVPLTLLSAIALSPLLLAALSTRAPHDAPTAHATLARGWSLVATAWLGQLLLVGGAAAIADGRPSQLRAFTGGLTRLVRAIVPCLTAALAIALGSLALALPGLVLFVLLALTAASPERGVPAPLLDSIAVARRHGPAVALTAFAMLALDVAIGLAAYRAYVVPMARPPTPAQLAALPGFVRAIAVALVIVSPLPATVLATIRARATA